MTTRCPGPSWLAEADGDATRVTLDHTDREGFGEGAEAARDGSDEGWDLAFETFVASV